jgi:hypothetical protein
MYRLSIKKYIRYTQQNIRKFFFVDQCNYSKFNLLSSVTVDCKKIAYIHHKNQEHSIFLFLTHVNQPFVTFNGMRFFEIIDYV